MPLLHRDLSKEDTMRSIDLTGQRFGRLLTVKTIRREGQNAIFWICLCDCGNKAIVTTSALRAGNTRSCGCLFKEARKNNTSNLRHGYRRNNKTPVEYNIWKTMRQRCGNPNDRKYKYYGGRGITICKRWDNFVNFFIDMGPKPPGYSIERIDNNLGYFPDNCKWIPKEDQPKNRRPYSEWDLKSRH